MHGRPRSLGPGFGAGTDFAGVRGHAFGVTFQIAGLAQVAFRFGQGVGGDCTARLGLGDGVGQFLALDRNFLGRGRGFGQFILGFCFAGIKFGNALGGGVETVLPA